MLDAIIECQQCAFDGAEDIADPAGDDGSDEPLMIDEMKSDSYTNSMEGGNTDEYLELGYTADAAKLAYQGDGEGQMAEPILPKDGEHL